MHSFDPKIAGVVGINAAILYQNILWWCEKNAANGHNMHDGRFWTFNSVKAWSTLFPYMTAKQIRTALDRLEADGLVLSGCFNPTAYDRTKWYCPAGQFDLPSRANGVAHEGEPIPVGKPVIKPDVTPLPPKGGRADAAEISETLCAWASPDAVASFIAYRRRSKGGALTLTAAKRLAGHLKEIFNAGGDTNAALGLAEEHGWTTIKPDWYFNDKNRAERGSNRPGSGMAAAFAEVARRASAGER